MAGATPTPTPTPPTATPTPTCVPNSQVFIGHAERSARGAADRERSDRLGHSRPKPGADHDHGRSELCRLGGARDAWPTSMAPGAPGVNAPIIITLTGFPAATSGTYSNSFAITPTQVTQLQGGLSYFNIHNGTFPNGEIRGQLTLASCPPATTPTPTATAHRELRDATPTATANGYHPTDDHADLVSRDNTVANADANCYRDGRPHCDASAGRQPLDSHVRSDRRQRWHRRLHHLRQRSQTCPRPGHWTFADPIRCAQCAG